jgi:predicted O-linked N-acetylglucosamine transferase (SPINDLY family)
MGVSSHRLLFSEHVKDRNEYLLNMQAADVALDTPTYSSGSLAVEVCMHFLYVVCRRLYTCAMML